MYNVETIIETTGNLYEVYTLTGQLMYVWDFEQMMEAKADGTTFNFI